MRSGTNANQNSVSASHRIMNPIRFDRPIQICVGKASAPPVLDGLNFAWLGFEFATDLASPRALSVTVCTAGESTLMMESVSHTDSYG